ncbi:hypothetical protein COW36_19400 [bacterium (Candidatus Blackallbacteria) CG17_big_fil_post_rev_8_21_14_2_50_48_46]|uniref:Uncharacterized protein n=1 Tax=bacterium (Candidatus Blackallbacteria) CG17_big_fil_post_rev_8_21_14_2_50_48_46 TaxID=2014261 RepID=A0A2M7G088_9BACT|nr:MAG: hypothetical protein COW64_25070 [bacterium (Candidatus Blackallbacteria) CG18_big_fil_WC_8_21_14_2_50_49_26]PIW15089.1 MAG: hypothetical protein COW36_19400 [bacterium (Candidatus Blackallbacteria) CG17_big_fil_post_rev_8_21_14_2_50_48_46]PIW47588.1 MAG: hypothetical protein COW20_11920 [bacterium (Candidatus Blackallbacteria) CG13_big_fil_rev_8_21_14_2_50_49_14]
MNISPLPPSESQALNAQHTSPAHAQATPGQLEHLLNSLLALPENERGYALNRFRDGLNSYSGPALQALETEIELRLQKTPQATKIPGAVVQPEQELLENLLSSVIFAQDQRSARLNAPPAQGHALSVFELETLTAPIANQEEEARVWEEP